VYIYIALYSYCWRETKIEIILCFDKQPQSIPSLNLEFSFMLGSLATKESSAPTALRDAAFLWEKAFRFKNEDNEQIHIIRVN
jgi:hypothetical protein